MTWVRIDDHYFTHRKTLLAGPMAAVLDIAAWCYTAGAGTDGFLEAEVVPSLVYGLRGVAALAAKLVAVGRWERVEGGYMVHDYLDFNPPSDKVQQKRKVDRERLARWRETHGVTEGETPDETPLQTEGETPLQTSDVTRYSPRPVPVPPLTTSVSQSTSVGPAAADDDDDLTNSDWWKLAESDLAERERAKGSVANRTAWLRTAACRRRDANDTSQPAPADAGSKPNWYAAATEPTQAAAMATYAANDERLAAERGLSAAPMPAGLRGALGHGSGSGVGG